MANKRYIGSILFHPAGVHQIKSVYIHTLVAVENEKKTLLLYLGLTGTAV